MGSGNPPSQTNALNKDILAQEGLLGAILLNNQHLIREHESLLKILLGSKALPAGKDHLLEAAGSLALEGLLWSGVGTLLGPPSSRCLPSSVERHGPRALSVSAELSRHGWLCR